MKKALIFFIIIFFMKTSFGLEGYWQCRLENNICISTCMGNLDDCFKSELCNCVNPYQGKQQTQEQETIIDFGKLELNVKKIDPVQTKSRVLIDLRTTKPSRIEMIDNNKNYLICKKCTIYKGFKSFKEGSHKITITAVDESKNIDIKESAFIIDTKKPKIIRNMPKNKQKTSSYIFSVQYSEDNLKEIALYFKQGDESAFSVLKRDDCASSTKENKYPICEFDLTNYLKPGKIYFNFMVSDQNHKTSMRKDQNAVIS